MGLALAAMIAVLLVQGGPGAFRWSFILMAVATFIDATDGTLARKVRIKEVIPGFDGRTARRHHRLPHLHLPAPCS